MKYVYKDDLIKQEIDVGEPEKLPEKGVEA